jgi:hypothetical protein
VKAAACSWKRGGVSERPAAFENGQALVDNHGMEVWRRRMLALALAAVAGASVPSALSAETGPVPARVVVPNVVRLWDGVAAGRVCALGLVPRLEVIKARLPGAARSGTQFKVRATRPRAGQSVPKGSTVWLRIVVPRDVDTVWVAVFGPCRPKRSNLRGAAAP